MRILVVEDQKLIGKAIRTGLTEEGFAVDWVTTYVDGLHLATEADFDAIVLDLSLPDGSGLDLLKAFREVNTSTPVLILTAKDTLADKTLGFRLGGDDYVTKPFAFEELLARVRALTQRRYGFHAQLLRAEDLLLDLTARVASVGPAPLNLTSKEFALLEILLLQRGRIQSREKLLERLYSDGSEQGSNVIDVFVNKVRRKLEAAGGRPVIETVRGEGYVVR